MLPTSRRPILTLALSGLLAGLAACDSDGPTASSDVIRNQVFHAEPFCQDGAPGLAMDLHFPAADVPANAPAALHYHGGGWVSGARGQDPWFDLIGPALVERGWVVATSDYRLAPAHQWPAQIEDAKCAVRHLRANAQRYGIDPDSIVTWGPQAGAHLAAMAGLTGPEAGFEGSGYEDTSSEVLAVVTLAAPTALAFPESFPAMEFRAPVVFGVDDLGHEILVQASPVTHVSAGAPAHLIIHGIDDGLVPHRQATLLYEALSAVGVHARKVLVEGANHILQPSGPEATVPGQGEIVEEVVEFIESQVRGGG